MSVKRHGTALALIAAGLIASCAQAAKRPGGNRLRLNTPGRGQWAVVVQSAD